FNKRASTRRTNDWVSQRVILQSVADELRTKIVRRSVRNRASVFIYERTPGRGSHASSFSRTRKDLRFRRGSPASHETRSLEVRSVPLAPERDAAEQSRLIGNDLDILAGFEGDLLGVAAAEIKVVPVEKLVGLFDRFLQQLVPALLTVFIEAAPTQVVLIFAVSLPRMMAELQPRAKMPVRKKR